MRSYDIRDGQIRSEDIRGHQTIWDPIRWDQIGSDEKVRSKFSAGYAIYLFDTIASRNVISFLLL